MTEKLQQIIIREVAKLPKDIQDVINASNWVIKSEEIGKKFLLGESEINDLQLQTLLVVVGLVDPDDYASDIEDGVGTSKDEAKKIAVEMEEKVFTPIYNTTTENIKKSGKDKKGNMEQNLNFILSGGDYSSFLEQREETSNEIQNSPINVPSAPANIPMKPKMSDIKSKFTI